MLQMWKVCGSLLSLKYVLVSVNVFGRTPGLTTEIFRILRRVSKRTFWGSSACHSEGIRRVLWWTFKETCGSCTHMIHLRTFRSYPIMASGILEEPPSHLLQWQADVYSRMRTDIFHMRSPDPCEGLCPAMPENTDVKEIQSNTNTNNTHCNCIS